MGKPREVPNLKPAAAPQKASPAALERVRLNQAREEAKAESKKKAQEARRNQQENTDLTQIKSRKKLNKMRKIMPHEVIAENYKLWSISNKLMIRCADEYGIDYCKKNDVPAARKIRLLVEIITNYNVKINNPDFEDITEEEDFDLENGSKVFLPPKEYLVKALKQAQEDVKDDVEPIRRGNIPMYAGRDAAKMEKFGNQFIAPPKHPPQIVIPHYRQKSGEYLDPYVEAGHGRMPKSKTKGLVIHSTEGGADILREGQNIHYILRRDGVIELIRDMDIAVSHAGNMTSKKASKHAMWEGEKEPSFHTVGIEVINPSLPSLIKEGKVNVALDSKAKVFSATIRWKDKKGRAKSRVALLTSTPPKQKAIDAGFKQARVERGFTDEQYKSLKAWIAYVGNKKGLKYKDIVTHSMIACSDSGRGRKSDPPVLDWGRLGLMNNHYRVDADVAEGRVKANIDESERIRTGKKMTMVKYKGKIYYEVLPSVVNGKDAYSYFPEARFGGTDSMIAGVSAAEKIRKSKAKKTK